MWREELHNRESYSVSLEFLPSLGLFIFGVKFTSTIKGKLDWHQDQSHNPACIVKQIFIVDGVVITTISWNGMYSLFGPSGFRTWLPLTVPKAI